MTQEVRAELDRTLRPRITAYAARLLPLVEHAPDALRALLPSQRPASPEM
jgi:hypothetical protein